MTRLRIGIVLPVGTPRTRRASLGELGELGLCDDRIIDAPAQGLPSGEAPRGGTDKFESGMGMWRR